MSNKCSTEIKCVGNELRESGGAGRNSSGFPKDTKKEFVSESDAEMKSFVKCSKSEMEITSFGKKGLTEITACLYYCGECEIHFRHIYSYERHFKENHPKFPPFSCQFCGKSHWFKRNYIRHVRRFHPENSDCLQIKTPSEIKCELCDATHKGTKALEKHLLNVHRNVKAFKCALCEAKYFRSSDLNFHVQNKHRIHDGDEDDIFRCNVCNYVFENSDLLKSHTSVCKDRQKMKMLSPPDEKPFKCNACGAGFRRKSNLTQHYENTHGTAILPCSYCTKSYSLMTVLRRHERNCGKKHAKKEAYFCDICLNWRSGSFDSHKHHHNDYDHCEFCNQRFHKYKNPLGLLKHTKKRHPNCFQDDSTGMKALLNAAKELIPQERIKKESDEI